jgi:hypothetical protein
MAEDNRAVDQRYIDQTKGQQDKLADAHTSGTKRYGDLRTASDAAYEAMKTEARINKALSDLAGGPASSSMTHRQRSESALRNEIGDTGRQQQDYSKEIYLALKNLDAQNAADQAYITAINNALRNADKLQRNQFDAELGIKQKYHDLAQKNSTFDQMYKLYTSRRIDKNAFKDATGIAVKAIPAPRRVAVKPKTTAKFVGGKAPEKNTPGYETVVVYSVWSGIPTYYEVKTDTAKVLIEKGVSLQDKNGHIKSEPELYATTYYEGFAGASYAEQQKILTEHADDFTKQFGDWYYGAYNNHLTSMDAAQHFSATDQANIAKAFYDMLDAVNSGSNSNDAVNAYNTAFDNGFTHLAESTSGAGLWSMFAKLDPQTASQFQYTAGVDDVNALVDAPPSSATSQALAASLKKRFGDLDGSLIKDVFDQPELAELNIDWSQLSADQLLAVSAYLTAKFNPRMVSNGAMENGDKDIASLIQSGKAIYEDVEKNYMHSIIEQRNSLETDEARESREAAEYAGWKEGALSMSNRFNKAVEYIRQYQIDWEEYQFYTNYDIDSSQSEIEKLEGQKATVLSNIINMVYEDYFGYIDGVGYTDEVLEKIRADMERTGDGRL